MLSWQWRRGGYRGGCWVCLPPMVVEDTGGAEDTYHPMVMADIGGLGDYTPMALADTGWVGGACPHGSGGYTGGGYNQGI